MSKQESLKFLQGLIDEVENWTKEDIERGRKLMEKIYKEKPKEVENSDGYWEFIMPDGKVVDMAKKQNKNFKIFGVFLEYKNILLK